MTRRSTSVMILASLLAGHGLLAAEPRGREPKSSPGRGAPQKSAKPKPPGGDWSEVQHHSGQKPPQSGAASADKRTEGSSASAKAPAEDRGPGTSKQPTPAQGAAAGAAAENRNAPKSSGAQGAAAGAAAANRNSPQYSGAQGAAAGAAAENRNAPKASGAQGAAAGAAAANRNSPQYSGAQGAAAGAAAENRNAPKYSGAQGAAAGAAAANRNSPQYSGAEGAVAGAAAENRNAPKYSGAQGAAAGAAAANRNSPQYSGAEGAVAGADAVRRNYNNPNLYSNAWYGAHPGVWAPTAYVGGSVWTASSWPTVAGFYGTAATPVSYGYGSNVVAQQGNVMVNGQNVGTTAQFSQQAAELAQAGAEADADTAGSWLPLGVFAMVRHEQEKPNLILQMAIDEQGVLRGNYTDEATQTTLPIHGSVDPKTQRAAWMVGNNTTTVMEAGLSNMASGEAPALTHKAGKTDHWLLVRLEQPAAQ